ncbi:hypothetical protein ACIRL2_40530 [Embleya sp. NPDC127516]|uniref:hypothetical protein n=1 Tax=Embleya sp. NPDC127516 TaxID=3363990 RepID=UPI00381DEDBC
MDRSAKRLAAAAAVLILVAAGCMIWAAQHTGGLPDRACWGSIKARDLENAAPRNGAWKVKEGTDHRGDATCTIRKGDWTTTVTVMKTPLRTHLWWQLGAVPLGGRLPGMVKPGEKRTDGWLYLGPCGNRIVNADVPSSGTDDRASIDLTARLLLAVGDTRIRDCGGQTPFPAAHLQELDPRPRNADPTPCGIPGLPPSLDGNGEDLAQLGAIDIADAISRCAVIKREDAAGSAAFGPGLLGVTVVHDPKVVDALSPTGIRATVTATRGAQLVLNDEDLRYDRDGVTEVVCGTERRYVHLITAGTDADHAHSKRAVLNLVAEDLGCG